MATKPKRHKGTAKRIRVTAGGKLLHQHPYGNHFLSKKSGGRKRSIAHTSDLGNEASQKARRLLGV